VANDIKENAEREWKQKCEEYRRLQAQQDAIKDRLHSVRCYQDAACHMADGCVAYDLRRKNHDTQIGVFEYLVPRNMCAQDNLVFELQVPAIFAAWRDASIFMVVSVLNCRYVTKETPDEDYKYYLDDFKLLDRYYQYPSESSGPRTVLLSAKRPFSNSRYRKKNMTTVWTNQDIHLELAADFRYYDFERDQFVCRMETKDDSAASTLAKECKPRLPQLFDCLTPFLSMAGNTSGAPFPNEAMVQRRKCPESITVPQFLAMAGLRYPTVRYEVDFGWKVTELEIITLRRPPSPKRD
jgi:hypothetical protein